MICGGVQERFEDVIRARGIKTISGVYGTVDELLDLFIQGKLRADEPNQTDNRSESS